MIFYILTATLAFLALLTIASYNTLVRRRNETENAFGSIDAMVKSVMT